MRWKRGGRFDLGGGEMGAVESMFVVESFRRLSSEEWCAVAGVIWKSK